MTKVSEEEIVKPNQTEFQNGDHNPNPKVSANLETSSGSDSDNAVKTASESSRSSVASTSSSGTTTKLAARMADKVSLASSSPAEKRFKFEPNEDYLNQLLAMGISFNGAKKALYYTGNRSVALATNWIFDHPELDLETPLEEEMRRLEAEEEEAFDEDDEEEDSEEERLMHHHHLLHRHHVTSHNHHHNHYCHEEDEDELEEDELCARRLKSVNSASTTSVTQNGGSTSKNIPEEVYIDDSDEDTETESDDFDEEDIPEFKMVFVVNMSLEMGPGKVAAQVGHAALGVQRVLSSKAKNGKYKVSLTDIGLWQDFGENMVVVKGESTQHLKDLHLMAEDLELPSFLVKDAGITQVPSGAVTVFGVFGEDEDVNKITGRLKLM